MQVPLNSLTKLEFDKVKKQIGRGAISSLGAQRLEELHPSSSPDEIRRNLAFVSEMKRVLEETASIPFERVEDIRLQVRRTAIENYVLTSTELRAVSRLLSTSRTLHSFFSKRKDLAPALFGLVGSIHVDKVLEYNIDRAIDEEGFVKDSATKELAAIRRSIAEKNAALRHRLESILKSIAGKDWIQEEIITTREGRMVIPVKAEHKNRVPGFIHSASSSGATVFIEPTETLDLNNEIRTLQFQETREIEKILRELTGQVAMAQPQILAATEILGEVDFIQAKARYSIQIIGSEPLVGAGRTIRLMGARHPLLLQRHPREEVVPLDIEMGEDPLTVIITGPNAGGKSVALKAIGLLCVMAQSGCHIPAAPESTVPVFDSIFVEMGDEQSIENDLSSFSSHLKNLKEILEGSTNRSLVLIDEIGSGTDPTEGASLAGAVLTSLTSRECTTVATTHHGSLKAFAYETPRISNAAMEFDSVSLQPRYRLRLGVPGSSYAIEMAKRLRLPEEIIRDATSRLGGDKQSLERLIMELEQKSQVLSKNVEQIEKEKADLTTLTQLYVSKVTAIEQEHKAMRLKAVGEAESILERSKSIVEKTVREIRERNAAREAIRGAKEEITGIERELADLKKSVAPEPVHHGPFETGAWVRLKGSTTAGTVLQALEEDYMVLFGDMKLRVRGSDLEESAGKPAQARGLPGIQLDAAPQREIDLRGMYPDEAVEAVERFIDAAVLAGLQRLDIIHGKGTGVLRKRISALLKGHASVKTFRLGEWNEGGSGVTVVELA